MSVYLFINKQHKQGVGSSQTWHRVVGHWFPTFRQIVKMGSTRCFETSDTGHQSVNGAVLYLKRTNALTLPLRKPKNSQE